MDYSGKGTVISGKIADNGDVTVSNGRVNIPIYQGKYEAGALDWWILHSWSSLGTGNNKTNNYTTYRGPAVTEYDVESRQEHQYKRYEKQDTYRTKYHTTYQGSKWYNCGIFLFTSQWDKYEGNRDNYKIIKQWTTEDKTGTIDILVKSTEWRTSAPFSYAWENKWEAYSTRTTYRYRSRTMTWNEKGGIGYEQVPLNYSLYNKDGTPIGNGVKWELEHKLTPKTGFWFIGRNDADRNEDFSVIQYYIPFTALVEDLKDEISKLNLAFEGEHLYSDVGSMGRDFILEMMALVLKYYGYEVVAGPLGKIASVLFILDVYNLVKDIKTYETLKQAITDLINLSNSSKVLVVTVEKTDKFDIINPPSGEILASSTPSCGQIYATSVLPPMATSSIDIEFATVNKLSYATMKYNVEQANKLNLKLGFHDDKPEYGKISYLYSLNEIFEYMNRFIERI